jgi:uncharacterized protein
MPQIERLPRMSKEEVDDLIHRQYLCRIAFNDKTHPYIAPFQYAYVDGSLYFHFTDYGRKMKLIEIDPKICVEIEDLGRDLHDFEFVVLRGSLKRVNDPAEREKALTALADIGRRRLSPRFLAAHGLPEGSGWGDITGKKLLILLKLTDVKESFGLKSPH